MNVIADSASPGGDRPETAPTGELVVQNGRMKGARRPLANPLTLIGQAAGCEVRLNVEGIRPLHCAIAHGPEGYVLRDLSGDRGSQINGEPVTIQPLKDGDLLTIGPFQFKVAIPEQIRPEVLRRAAGSLKAERDALRIQAAAVASQQAGLTEEEIRLEQRRAALQRQEEQLSARLDERQRQLREQDEQLRQEFAAFQEEREAEDQRQAMAREHLVKARLEQDKNTSQSALERRRLVELRKGLKRRWKKQWNAKQAEMDRREKGLAAMQTKLAAESGHLEREQQKFAELRLRVNGENELGRRQLQEEWQELGLAQQQWEDTLNQEHADRNRRIRELKGREQALAHAESELEKERQFWSQHRAVLEMDVDGLEKRVLNQRQKLRELERTRPNPAGMSRQGDGSPEPAVTRLPQALSTPSEPGIELSEGVKRVADLVADQRWHLLEQWERVLRLQDDWEKERAVVLAELETATERLQQREKRLEERGEQIRLQETVLEGRVGQLQQRQESLSQLRCSLEGWQSRLQSRTVAWEAEREEVLSSVRAREEAVATQIFQADELHRKRTERFKQRTQAVRDALQKCAEMRRQYVVLWKACQEQHKKLLAEQQSVGKQTLTLERFRMECLAQVHDQVAAEKRLERLQRNCDALSAEAEQQLERDRRILQADVVRLDERARLLDEVEKDLLQRSDVLAAELTERENQQVVLRQGEARRKQEMESIQVRHQLAEQQIKSLRDEVERLAQMLLEEVDSSVPAPAANPSQAA